MSKIIKEPKAKNPIITQIELNKLAHEGTKEAIAKIKAYIKSEKDCEKKAYAEMALEECEFLYYQPRNEKEEQDFELCRLINKYKRHIDDLEVETDIIREGLARFKLEQDVHKQVLARNKNRKEAWQYHCMDDFVASDKNRLMEIMDDIAYKKAWVEAAEKMIFSARYKGGMPKRQLSHFCFGDNRYVDDGGCDCCADGSCPDCQEDYDMGDIKDMPY